MNRLRAPYGYGHTRAGSQAYALAAVVERETGLRAYDPQVEQPLSELPPQRGTAIMSSITNAARKHLASEDGVLTDP